MLSEGGVLGSLLGRSMSIRRIASKQNATLCKRRSIRKSEQQSEPSRQDKRFFFFLISKQPVEEGAILLKRCLDHKGVVEIRENEGLSGSDRL